MPVSADQLEFRLLLESSVDAVMIHDPETYDVIWANRVAADIYGCSPDELTKMTYKDLAPRDPTYSLEGSRIELQRSMAKDHNTFEWRIRRSTGEEFPIDLTLTQIPGSDPPFFTAFIRDMTSRRESEEALKRSEARKTAVLETALDAIISVDQQGKVIEWNPAAERVFGYSRELALGRNMTELIEPRSTAELQRRGLSRFLQTGRGRRG